MSNLLESIQNKAHIFMTIFIIIFSLIFASSFIIIIVSVVRHVKTIKTYKDITQQSIKDEIDDSLKSISPEFENDNADDVKKAHKIKCPYCGSKYTNDKDKCPSCGAKNQE